MYKLLIPFTEPVYRVETPKLFRELDLGVVVVEELVKRVERLKELKKEEKASFQ